MINNIIGTVLLALGCFTLVISILGVFNFNFVMNRMHCAAIIDSIGFFLVIFGLLFLKVNFSYIPKLLLVLLFQWVSSPIASHMLARLEIEGDEDSESHMKKEEA